ncbi:hypothetical protein C8Q77DRAFT_1057523 [Trametes polyzona]|nr:hypothetical protein C8Q77DRAFT_1057523 [Trametes polyzona]
MESLPLETLQRIFELSSTDGGYTACSLSLTSRDVRAAARTTRFHTVSLVASPRRLISFAELYERVYDIDGADKPRIAHLHITFPRIRAHSPFEGQWGGHARGRRSSSECVHGTDPTTSNGYLSAVHTVFHLAAPDLVTLAIQSGFTSGGSLEVPLADQPFPKLRELTVVGVRNPHSIVDFNTTALPVFPALTHLHIVPGHAHCELYLPFWSVVAPGVTHMRVTGLDSVDHIQEFSQAIGAHIFRPSSPIGHFEPLGFSAQPSLPALPMWTYPSLRTLLIQPCATASEVHKVIHFAAHVILAEHIQKAGLDITATMLDKLPAMSYRQQAKEVRRGWTNRAEGRLEWWATRGWCDA